VFLLPVVTNLDVCLWLVIENTFVKSLSLLRQSSNILKF
jgi:hypothetical protein